MKALVIKTKTVPAGVSKKTGKPYQAFTIYTMLSCRRGEYDVRDVTDTVNFLEDATFPVYAECSFGLGGVFEDIEVIAQGGEALKRYAEDVTA